MAKITFERLTSNMSDSPDHLSAVSVRLSRALDELGMSSLTVKRRRHAMLFEEKLFTIRERLGDDGYTLYKFGSKSEGTTTVGMGSDSDAVYCLNSYHVIQDWSDWQQGKTNLLMVQDMAAPGYCRLQLLRSDMPVPHQNLPNDKYTYDECNRVVMKNTAKLLIFSAYQMARNGPAQSHTVNNTDECDMVVALECNKMLADADAWINKCRPTDWPSQDLIKEIDKRGFFLVPVGYKLSQRENLEWRISFSLTERLLMFSLNIIQLKCYVILKMLMKSLVVPIVRESISSYHCKTALFHCIEATGMGFWREENLLRCINMCLSLILEWVKREHCPHFIIPESNLFAGKIGCHNKHKLVSILQKLLDSDGRFLLLIPMDDLCHRMRLKLGQTPRSVSNLRSQETILIAGVAIFNGIGIVACTRTAYVVEHHAEITPRSFMQSVLHHICLLNGQIRHEARYEREATRGYLNFLKCLLGSLLASASLSHKIKMPRQALKLFCQGAKNDIANQLKLASVFLCNGDLQKAELILQNIEMHFERKLIITKCMCYPTDALVPRDFLQQIYLLEDSRAISRLFAYCVIFSPQEIHCATPAMRQEINRSMGDDIQQRDDFFDKWMALAIADAPPYLYYLQYLTYVQLGNRDLQTRALLKLERSLRDVESLRHLETAWNLLGQCMEDEHNLERAKQCYMTSLEIRPRNNAANWHLQNLAYKDTCILGEKTPSTQSATYTPSS